MMKNNLIRWLILLTVIGITFSVQKTFAEEAVSEEQQDIYYEESTQSDEVPKTMEIEDSMSVSVENVDETVVATILEEPSLVQTNENNLEISTDLTVFPSPTRNEIVEEYGHTYLYHSGTKQYDTVYTNGNAKFYFETSGVLSRQKWSYSNKTATWYYSDANGEIIKEAALAHYVERGKQLYDIVVNINQDRYYYEPHYWGGVQSRNKWAYGVQDGLWYYTDTTGRIRKEANDKYYRHDGVQQSDTVLDINGTRYYYEPQHWGSVQSRNKWAYGVKDATWYYTDTTGRIRKEANRHYYKHDGVQQSDTVLDINGTHYYYEPQHWGSVQSRNKWAYGVKDATWYYTDTTGRIRKEANRHYYKHDGVQQSDTVLDINGTRYYYEPQHWGSVQSRNKWAYGVKDATWYYTDATGRIRKEANRHYYKHDGVQQSDTVLDINGTHYYYEPAAWGSIQARSKWSYGVQDATWYETNSQGHIIQRSKISPFVREPKKETVTEIRKEVVPFGTDNLDDPQLDKGKVRIEAGHLGEDTLTYEITKVDGVVTQTRLVSRQRTKAPVNKKVYTGTKDVITERTYTRDEVIPIPTAVEGLQDEHLPVGQTRNEAGVAGLERVTYRVVSINGVERAPEVVMRQVLKSAVKARRYTGTKVEEPKLPPVMPEQPPIVTPETPQSEPIVPPINEPKVVKQLSETKIEFKNIQSAYLYKVHNNQIQRVLTLSSPEGAYYIKATLENGRHIWLDVERITEEENGYSAHASLSDVVTLSQDSTYRAGYTVTIPKRRITQTPTVITTFTGLLEAIRQNTSGTFTIDNHLSADEVSLSDEQQSYISSTFSGTLTANPQSKITIFDLKKPLFNQLLNAKISNIQFQEGHVRATTDSQVGLLAKVADASTSITNIHAKGSITGHDEVGGIIGRLDNHANITDVSFSGYVSAEKIAGGIVGVATRGATVSRAYADVTMASMSRQEIVRVGGLIGNLGENATLTNSFVEGLVTNYSAAESVGGAIGHVSVATDVTDMGRIENILSAINMTNGDLLIGNLQDLTGKTLNQLKIYQNQETRNTSNTRGEIILVDASTARAFKRTFKKFEEQIFNRQINDYQRVFGYRDNYHQAYRNVEKLLPFFDRETIVQQANKLPLDDNLVMKRVESVQIFNNNQRVTKLYGNLNTINRLVVQYTDNTQDTWTLNTPTRFKQTGIHTYQIKEKNILFQLDRFVTDYSSVINSVTEAVKVKELTPDLFNQYNITKNYYDHRTGGGVPLRDISAYEKVRRTYLDTRFNEVKQEVGNILHRLIEEDDIYTNGSKVVQTKLQQAQDALLVGLTYIDRWYQFGNLKERLLFELPTTASQHIGSGLDLVLSIGRENTDALDSRLTAVTYSQVLAPFTEKWTLAQLLHDQAQQETGVNTPIDTWLKQVATAYLVTTKDDTTGRNLIFDRLIKPQNTHMILPLLSGKSPNVYAIFTTDSAVFGIMDTYLAHQGEAEYTRVKELIRTSGASIQRFFDLLRRVLKTEAVARLKGTNLLVFDSYADRWLGWKGTQEDVVKNFAGPIGRWIPRNNHDGAYAQGESVHFVGNKVLTESGLSTLTHEHTHNIDNKILFNNYGRRGNHGAENYALGLFQSVATGSTTHGFNLVYEKPKNQYNWYYNASPERFRSAEDLQTYYRGVFDVLYTLDHAEADAILRQGVHYIEQNYRRLEPLAVRNSYHKQDQVTHLGTLGTVQTIDDLVDQGVVAAGNAGRDRLNHGSVYGHNGYYTVDLFDAQYGILENDKGHSGGFTLRRVAFELLAEKGYYEGMIPYITNQYFAEFLQEKRSGETLSDSYVLQKIFPENEYSSFNDFRKKMFARRKAAADKIKPISIQWWDASESRYQTAHLSDYNSIRQLFVTALERNPYNRFAMTNLKKQIFKEYLERTDEFRTSIYRD